eukprot:11534981-Alexandrium_andersonii.AAC.1
MGVGTSNARPSTPRPKHPRLLPTIPFPHVLKTKARPEPGEHVQVANQAIAAFWHWEHGHD